MGGGGVSSPYNPIEIDPVHGSRNCAPRSRPPKTGAPMSAVHAYTPHSIQQAIRAGVKVIEHGQLADEETARMMAEKGIWWSLQPLAYDAHVFARMPRRRRRLALQVFAGTDNAYALAKKYRVKTAFGADILFDAAAASRQGCLPRRDGPLEHARRGAQDGDRQ